MSNTRKLVRLAALVALLPFAACSDVLSLDVEAPGRISDTDLNIPGAMSGIASGALSHVGDGRGCRTCHGNLDLGLAAATTAGSPSASSRPTSKLGDTHLPARAGPGAGSEMLRSRAAEYEKNASVAKAYLMGGFANRLLGEAQCRVNFDELVDGAYIAGPDRPHTDAFIRADSMFTRAIAVGTAAGTSAANIVTAAYGGRASVRAWQGKWDEAVVDAAKVPTTFVWNSTFSTANTNYIWVETNSRREMTLYTVMWGSVVGDPRVPWQTTTQKGQDGQTTFYRQLKYKTNADDIPITHGAEMRVLQAEAALRKSDYTGAQTFLNQARSKWSMAPITLSTTPADAWATLRFERYATLFLEGRKLWDWRRWAKDGAPMLDPASTGRDMCFPIGQGEQRANPNIRRGEGGQWGGCPTCG
jgi:hypothetical protein